MTTLQKYLSYIFRIVVEQTSSRYNPQLIVAIQEGKYVLNAKNANYSFATLHKVFQQALNKIDLKEIETILVLGGGAGSIPTIIYNEIGLNPKIDAIEIDEKVIELGNKYFRLNQFPNLNIVIDDASRYIKSTKNKYDLILVDLFTGIDVPEEFLKQHFFNHLKSLFNDKGQLLFNYVAYNYETKKNVETIEQNLRKCFSDEVQTYKFESINRIFHVKS